MFVKTIQVTLALPTLPHRTSGFTRSESEFPVPGTWRPAVYRRPSTISQAFIRRWGSLIRATAPCWCCL